MFVLIEHKNLYSALVLVLLIGNIFFAWSFFSISDELKTLEGSREQVMTNAKVLDFTAMFIKEVLKAEGEVNFETRLSLENAVRDLKDEEIIAHWQRFVGSKTEANAQQSVKDLLEVLVNKIR